MAECFHCSTNCLQYSFYLNPQRQENDITAWTHPLILILSLDGARVLTIHLFSALAQNHNSKGAFPPFHWESKGKFEVT